MRYFLLIFCFTAAFSQTKGVVIDSIGNPIPYVNIWVDGENSGTTSQEDGSFIINSTLDKVLVFSAVGFETKKTTTNNGEKIVLQSKTFELDEVLIFNLKNTAEYVTTDAKNRFYLPEPQITPWILGRKFLSKDDFKFVRSLIFYTNSEVEKGKFRIRIFKAGSNGLPAEDLLAQEVVVIVKKGKKKTIINVLEHKIKIPVEGIIVAFECLVIENNKYMQTAYVAATKEKVSVLNYSPHIMYFHDQLAESYTYRSGKWMSFSKEFLSNNPNYRAPIPAIDLILTN